MIYSEPFNHFIAYRKPYKSCELISNEVITLLQQKRSRELNRALYKLTVSKIILNLFVVYKHHHNKTVGISRAKNYWDKKNFYHHPQLKYTNVINCLNALEQLDWIKTAKKGYYDDFTRSGETTRYRATKRLIEAFSRDKLSLYGITLDEEYDKTQGIVLRGKKLRKTKHNPSPKGKQIPFDITPDIKQMQQNLSKLNWALQRTDIGLFINKKQEEEIINIMRKKANDDSDEPREIHFNNKTLHRVFNEDFTKGGRFYGGFWQQIPKQYRSVLTINNKTTYEQDYSFMHLFMIYLREGQQLTTDPYMRCAGDRTSTKLTINFMINSDNIEDCLNAMRKEINITKPEGFRTYKDYLDHVAEQFNSINHYFFTGYGRELQRLDSDIAEYVLMDMLNKGYVVLPVHDSFVCQTECIAELIDSMNKAAIVVLKTRLYSEPQIPWKSYDFKINKTNSNYYQRRNEFIRVNELDIPEEELKIL